VQATDQVRVSRVGEAHRLIAEDYLGESVVEEGIFHVELLNKPGTRDSSSEHRANSGRFYNRVECLVVVDSGVLSVTPKDPTGLVAIKGPVSTELVREDPLVGDNVGALRLGNQLPGPIAPYSSSIDARQWGSASASRAEEGIGDGVDEEVAAVRTR
jgi:translation initiation factor 2 gamma subunit (eIF-2gamma)